MNLEYQMAMFSIVLASLTLLWFCFVRVYFGHTSFSQKIGTNQLNAIFPEKICCNFSYKNLF